MQRFDHKLTTLTVVQKFFIERAVELLYRGTIDSYRVRVRNPKSILLEIKQAIEAFANGQVKHFIAIAAKEKTQFALKDEAIMLCTADVDYLVYKTFSKEYFISCLRELSEYNYKQLRNCLAILLKENTAYTETLLTGVKALLKIIPASEAETFILLEKIDKAVNFLFTDLVDLGFSKGFLYRHIYGLFINSLDEHGNFDLKFEEFESRIRSLNNSYTIIFRIDTTKKVKQNIKSTLAEMSVCENINDITSLKGTSKN